MMVGADSNDERPSASAPGDVSFGSNALSKEALMEVSVQN